MMKGPYLFLEGKGIARHRPGSVSEENGEKNHFSYGKENGIWNAQYIINICLSTSEGREGNSHLHFH